MRHATWIGFVHTYHFQKVSDKSLDGHAFYDISLHIVITLRRRLRWLLPERVDVIDDIVALGQRGFDATATQKPLAALVCVYPIIREHIFWLHTTLLRAAAVTAPHILFSIFLPLWCGFNSIYTCMESHTVSNLGPYFRSTKSAVTAVFPNDIRD